MLNASPRRPSHGTANPLANATEGYTHLAARDDGWTKVVLKTAALLLALCETGSAIRSKRKEVINTPTEIGGPPRVVDRQLL